MDAEKKYRLRRLLFIALLGMIVISIVLAAMRRGEWVIPEEAARRENSLAASAKNVEAARGLYKENCAECHGDAGKGDGPKSRKLFTDPSDLTNAARIGSLTDGALFYQISEGRRPMPEFRSRMTEEQRWQLVLLIRSLSGTFDPKKRNP
jgi:mono/diheme cytochrome c family protein